MDGVYVPPTAATLRAQREAAQERHQEQLRSIAERRRVEQAAAPARLVVQNIGDPLAFEETHGGNRYFRFGRNSLTLVTASVADHRRLRSDKRLVVIDVAEVGVDFALPDPAEAAQAVRQAEDVAARVDSLARQEPVREAAVREFAAHLRTVTANTPRVVYDPAQQAEVDANHATEVAAAEDALATATADRDAVKHGLAAAREALDPARAQAGASLLEHRRAVVAAATAHRAAIRPALGAALDGLEAQVNALAQLEGAFAVGMLADAKIDGLPRVEPLSPELVTIRRLVAELRRATTT